MAARRVQARLSPSTSPGRGAAPLPTREANGKHCRAGLVDVPETFQTRPVAVPYDTVGYPIFSCGFNNRKNVHQSKHAPRPPIGGAYELWDLRYSSRYRIFSAPVRRRRSTSLPASPCDPCRPLARRTAHLFVSSATGTS